MIRVSENEACSTPKHRLNHCWFIVNWALGNQYPSNFNQNIANFIKENDFNGKKDTTISLRQTHNSAKNYIPASNFNSVTTILCKKMSSDKWLRFRVSFNIVVETNSGNCDYKLQHPSHTECNEAQNTRLFLLIRKHAKSTTTCSNLSYM